jgi:transposase-like protein
VRWYLRFGLSYRDVEELLAERGIEVDHRRIGLRVPDPIPTETFAAIAMRKVRRRDVLGRLIHEYELAA